MIFLSVAPLLIPLAGAALLLTLPRTTRVQGAVAILVSLSHCLVAALLLKEVQVHGITVTQIGSWAFPFGIGMIIDQFAALMIGVTALVGLTTILYSLGSISEDLVKRRYYALLQFLLAGVCGAFLAGDLFNLFVWFEVLLMASFVLLTLGNTGAQFEAGIKYLTINFFASTLFLAGAGLAFSELGTLSMVGLGAALSAGPASSASLFIMALLLVAFAVKAGVFPVYSWLPASYHTPPAAISAIFAGLLTKVGIFALYRAATLIFPSYHYILAPICLIVGLLTMITGVLGAVAQMNIKKVLSFHIISQIGYMVLALGFWSVNALAAGIFYVIHHIIVKTNLFFLAGIAERLCGTDRLAAMGGLYKRAPYLSLLFLVPALSLSGVPPLSGFFAKFTLVSVALEQSFFLSAGIALAVGILTLFSMTKIWNEAFWKEAPPEVRSPPSLKGLRWMIAASLLLACGTVLIGIYPRYLWEASLSAAEQMFNPTLYWVAAQGESAATVSTP